MASFLQMAFHSASVVTLRVKNKHTHTHKSENCDIFKLIGSYFPFDTNVLKETASVSKKQVVIFQICEKMRTQHICMWVVFFLTMCITFVLYPVTLQFPASQCPQFHTPSSHRLVPSFPLPLFLPAIKMPLLPCIHLLPPYTPKSPYSPLIPLTLASITSFYQFSSALC